MHSQSQPPTAASTSRGRRTAIHWAAAVLVGLLGLSAAWLLRDGGTGGELRRLPGAERRALYLRILETLRTTCPRATGPGLTDYCRDQAEFVARFPECDRFCRELAQRYAPKSAR
jgi:cytochrome b pre-mRNA-processing protein 3